MRVFLLIGVFKLVVFNKSYTLLTFTCPYDDGIKLLWDVDILITKYTQFDRNDLWEGERGGERVGFCHMVDVLLIKNLPKIHPYQNRWILLHEEMKKHKSF